MITRSRKLWLNLPRKIWLDPCTLPRNRGGCSTIPFIRNFLDVEVLKLFFEVDVLELDNTSHHHSRDTLLRLVSFVFDRSPKEIMYHTTNTVIWCGWDRVFCWWQVAPFCVSLLSTGWCVITLRLWIILSLLCVGKVGLWKGPVAPWRETRLE